jgi:hypothetical protein
MATKKPARTSRVTRTKAESEQEFERINAEENSREPLPAMEAKAREDYAEKVRESTKDVTVEAISQKLASVSMNIRHVIQNIESQLQESVANLVSTREAVKLEEETLEELYGKEIVASTTKSMIDEYQAKRDEVAAVNDQAVDNYEKARQERTKEEKEYSTKLEVERKRETEQYNYDIATMRRNESQKYDDVKRERDRTEKERIEQINKSFAEREAKIALAEKELLELRVRVAEFPAMIDSAVKKAEAIVGSVMKRNAEHEMQILQMQTKSQLDVSNNNGASFKQQLDLANNNITLLQNKLAMAEEKVAAIATEALKSASGQQTLAQMQAFTQNRDNNAAPRKA